MKKKIILSILVLMLVLLTGCNSDVKKEDKTNNSNTKQEEKSSVPEAKVDDLVIKFNMSSSFQKMKYRFPEKAMTSSLGTYTIMDYMNGSEFIFRIGMYFFDNKSVEQTMTDASIESVGTKTINGITWNAYEGDTKDGKKTKNFAYYYDGGTYTVTFIYDKNISDVITTFMNNISFE